MVRDSYTTSLDALTKYQAKRIMRVLRQDHWRFPPEIVGMMYRIWWKLYGSN